MNEIETPATYVRSLSDLLNESAARHRHLCPRQVLGVRLGLLGAQLLRVALPNAHKRLLVIVETDGRFADAVSVATGCTIGARTLRVVDHGKVAATFIDTRTGRAVRIASRHESRTLARVYAPQAKSRWHAQLEAYQVMLDDELFSVERVELTLSLEKLLSKPGCRTQCDVCGEEIINEREIVQENETLCRACAGDSYWRPVTDDRGEAKTFHLYECVPSRRGRLVEGQDNEQTGELKRSGAVVETMSSVE